MSVLMFIIIYVIHIMYVYYNYIQVNKLLAVAVPTPDLKHLGLRVALHRCLVQVWYN